jgi:HEAT repeat protein
MDQARALKAASKLRHDGDDGVRLATLHVLTTQGGDEASRAAASFLEDSSTAVRLAALRFLQRSSGRDLGISETEIPTLERLDRGVGLAKEWLAHKAGA